MNKASRSFSYENLVPGVYRMTPQADLTEGEDGFYKTADVGPSGSAKIYDFGNNTDSSLT